MVTVPIQAEFQAATLLGMRKSVPKILHKPRELQDC